MCWGVETKILHPQGGGIPQKNGGTEPDSAIHDIG